MIIPSVKMNSRRGYENQQNAVNEAPFISEHTVSFKTILFKSQTSAFIAFLVKCIGELVKLKTVPMNL